MSSHQTNIVVVGFIVRDNKIFIAKRSATKKFSPDKYELIGGHLDDGEQPEQALIREIKEEINLDVRVGRPVGAFTYNDDEGFKVEIAYLCYPLDEKEPKINFDDHSIHKWISHDEITQFEKEDEETVLLRKAFELVKEGE